MKVEKIKIEKLNPAKYNPRKDLQPGDFEYEKLKRSIEEFGYVEPVIWNEKTGNVVGGHQRLKLLIASGYTEVDCVILNLDETREKALNIALNKISGDWDKDKLSFLLSDLKASDFDIELTGFDSAELSDLFSEMDNSEVKEDSFDLDEALEEPSFVKLGDIWNLGKHRLMCGNSTSEEDFKKLMNSETFDMIFTDPPYNIDYKGVKDNRKIKNDKMAGEDFISFLKKSIPKCETVYVCCSWQYDHLFKKALCDLGMPPKSMIIWNKVIPAQNLDKYFKQHEIIFYHGKFGGEKTIRGDIWEVKRQQNTIHPTMKPLELIAMALKDNPKCEKVYDAFGGSGSTLIACEQLNRRCFMVELDPKYVGATIFRYANLQKGNEDKISVFRNGKTIPYSEIKTT